MSALKLTSIFEEGELRLCLTHYKSSAAHLFYQLHYRLGEFQYLLYVQIANTLYKIISQIIMGIKAKICRLLKECTVYGHQTLHLIPLPYISGKAILVVLLQSLFTNQHRTLYQLLKSYLQVIYILSITSKVGYLSI